MKTSKNENLGIKRSVELHGQQAILEVYLRETSSLEFDSARGKSRNIPPYESMVEA